MDEQMIDIAKSICRELCAECGDSPCYEIDPERWLEAADQDVHCRCVINAKLAHSVIAGKVAELTEAVTNARDILLAAPELNMSNFDIDQVSALNSAAGEAYVLLDAALAPYPERRSE